MSISTRPADPNAPTARLRAAALLTLAVLEEISRAPSGEIRQEIDRRHLEIEIRGLLHTVAELAALMVDRRRALPRDACPHCGWSISQPLAERCPRCSELRGVASEPPRALKPGRARGKLLRR